MRPKPIIAQMNFAIYTAFAIRMASIPGNFVAHLYIGFVLYINVTSYHPAKSAFDALRFYLNIVYFHLPPTVHCIAKEVHAAEPGIACTRDMFTLK